MLSDKQYRTKLSKLEAAVKRAELEVNLKREELEAADNTFYKALDELDKFMDDNR